MQAKDISPFGNGRYMAFGFSEDRLMGDDTILECIFDSKGETGEAFISFNDDPSSNFQLLDSSKKLLKNKKSLLKDGKMICSFELDLTEKDKVNKDEQPMIYDLESAYWMLLFATGLTDSATGEKLIHSLDEGDELYPWSTKKRISLKETIVVKNMGQT
uniref:DOMON domain-containing protein n=1 Tax=Panagrolaimus sp. ES5 TaxID=591445 RepID=A0AC34F2J3_9BILA